MSQWRNIRLSMRAVVAIAAVWAMLFSVTIAGANAASAPDIVFKTNGSAGLGLFACFKRHMTQRADSGVEKAPEGKSAAKHHCRCCLAAQAAAAVLPERLASPASPRRAPLRLFNLAATAREPKSVALSCAHGARAPPLPI